MGLNEREGIDYAFATRALKSGWTQVNFDNAGVEDHMMAVVELQEGVTAKQLKAAALSNDQSAFEKVGAPTQIPTAYRVSPTSSARGRRPRRSPS